MKFLKSTWPASRGHTEEERASRPDCFCIPIAKKRRLQLAENKARVREFLKSRGPDGGAIPERNLARGGSPSKRDAEREKRFEAKLQRQAQPRGYKLVPIEEKPAA